MSASIPAGAADATGPLTPEVESLLFALPDPMMVLRADGTVVFANPAAITLLGDTVLAGANFRLLCAEPDKLDFLCRRWLRSTDVTPGTVVLLTGDSQTGCRLLGARLQNRPDNPLVWVRITTTEQANNRFRALNTKIRQFAVEVRRRHSAEQELRETNDLLLTQKQLLELIVQGAALNSVLNRLIETVQRHTTPGAAISILLLDSDGIHLRHAAAPELPEQYTRMIDGLSIGPNVGSCGTAAFRKQPVFAGDILEHPYWSAFREAALASGMRACWSSPIMSQDNVVLGTFALYYREPHPDVSRDARVVEFCTKTAAIAIQRAHLEQQRAATEAALRKTESLAAAGRLAATVAHELNNPLEAVTNLVYLAKTNPEVPEPVRELLTIADQEIARASHIAHRTVGFYRENASPRPVNLSELVSDVLQLYSRKFTNKNLRLLTRVAPNVRVWAADGEVRQVISNLVANAVDACAEQDCVYVRVAVRRSGKRIAGGRVLVADTGCGIKPEVRPSIFDPFFTTKRDVGTGLGLWISRRIAEKHGGSLTFRSAVGPRHGTAFSLFLPQEPAPAS